MAALVDAAKEEEGEEDGRRGSRHIEVTGTNRDKSESIEWRVKVNACMFVQKCGIAPCALSFSTVCSMRTYESKKLRSPPSFDVLFLAKDHQMMAPNLLAASAQVIAEIPTHAYVEVGGELTTVPKAERNRERESPLR